METIKTSYAPRSITLKPADEDDPQSWTGEGRTLSEAAHALMMQLGELFAANGLEEDAALQPVFDGAAAILKADQEGEKDFVYEHRDFSCPEDNFNMTFK